MWSCVTLCGNQEDRCTFPRLLPKVFDPRLDVLKWRRPLTIKAYDCAHSWPVVRGRYRPKSILTSCVPCCQIDVAIGNHHFLSHKIYTDGWMCFSWPVLLRGLEPFTNSTVAHHHYHKLMVILNRFLAGPLGGFWGLTGLAAALFHCGHLSFWYRHCFLIHFLNNTIFRYNSSNFH